MFRGHNRVERGQHNNTRKNRVLLYNMAKKYASTDIVNTAKVFIYNKFVLYFVLLVALLNLLFSAVRGDYLFCALFVLIGFVSAFFNKNMTVILVVTIAASNIIRVLIRGGKFEGMTEKVVEEEEDATTKSDNEEEDKKTGKMGKKEDTDTKPELVEKVKTEAYELLDTQQKIIQGFKSIDGYMDKAGSLIEDIDKTAKKIEQMKEKAVAGR